ncbi:MAG TPA: ISL3 family transposase [bacterium]|nr:ISL3 family transposase [bacterium]
MELSRLLDLPHGLRVVEARIVASVVEVAISSHRPTSPCPRCGIPSSQIHSYYHRTVMDVSCVGRVVRLRLHVRKFRCPVGTCLQKVFTERLPDYVCPWARKTRRLVEVLTVLGMAVGGRGAESVAPDLGLRVSDQTVLRLLAKRPEPAEPQVAVLSVDDFAFRRSRAYGTVLLDLERHRVIDLLPDRSQLTFAQWLQQHPEVRVISRDRGGDYAAGASLGAPQAEQIADRFHLLQNAGEVLERCLTRHHAALTQAARALVPADAAPRSTKRTPAEARHQQERRSARYELYVRVVALHQQGVSSVQIAKQLGLARGTVLRYLRAASFPELAARPRPRQIDPYLPYLRERWNAGEHNARALWREIRAQGYGAGDEQVRRVVNAWRTDPHSHGNQPTVAAGLAKAEVTTYSARKTRWLLWKPVSELREGEARYVAALKDLCPQIAEAQDLLERFHTLVTERHPDRLDPWLDECAQSGISELVGFAQGLRRDYAAVKAALRYDWSQGPVEGHVNRLKTIKRQMYGRAGFALLRRRVLAESSPAA